MSVHGVIAGALNELSNCERALKAEDSVRALRELRSAIANLRGIESKVKLLERAAKNLNPKY